MIVYCCFCCVFNGLGFDDRRCRARKDECGKNTEREQNKAQNTTVYKCLIANRHYTFNSTVSLNLLRQLRFAINIFFSFRPIRIPYDFVFIQRETGREKENEAFGM